MGCGIGDFARRGLKMPKTQDFWVFILSPGDLDSQRHMGPRLAAQGTLTRSAGDLDSQRQLRSLDRKKTVFFMTPLISLCTAVQLILFPTNIVFDI